MKSLSLDSTESPEQRRRPGARSEGPGPGPGSALGHPLALNTARLHCTTDTRLVLYRYTKIMQPNLCIWMCLYTECLLCAPSPPLLFTYDMCSLMMPGFWWCSLVIMHSTRSCWHNIQWWLNTRFILTSHWHENISAWSPHFSRSRMHSSNLFPANRDFVLIIWKLYLFSRTNLFFCVSNYSFQFHILKVNLWAPKCFYIRKHKFSDCLHIFEIAHSFPCEIFL